LWDDFSAQKEEIVKWEKKKRSIDKKGYEAALELMKEINDSLSALKPLDNTEMMISVAPGVAADIAGSSFGAGTVVEPAKTALNRIRR
jgi:hypothetical protein